MLAWESRLNSGEDKEHLYKKITEVGNDRDFKLYLLKRMDAQDDKHDKLKEELRIFKFKWLVMIGGSFGFLKDHIEKLNIFK